MLEAINPGVAVQGQVHKIKSDSIAPAKVSKIADQNVRPDRKIKEEKNVEDGQKGKEDVQVSQDLLDELEHNINTIHNVGLEFSMHEESGRSIIKVVEKDTGDLIRQIPPDDVLDLIIRMGDVLGILFDERV
ncbi:MAG: flagellar protein FlaG [Thermodesulfobacteriota bacterium]|nr:flagellar protein FlaG [Thermodesulfobacteriota bacterium]